MSRYHKLHQFIETIHATDSRIVIAVTGGGSEAISRLLRVPAASRTVLEAIVPYSIESLAQFLGSAPQECCSESTARAMAMAAFQRGLQLTDGDEHRLMGVACTASLASSQPKRGAHRIHVALQSTDATHVASLGLSKGRRSRQQEESAAADLILSSLSAACGLNSPWEIDLVDQEQIKSSTTPAQAGWGDLLLGRADAIYAKAGASDRARPHSGLIFPGSFNPLHDGHRRMAALAAERTGRAVEYEISMENVDKPMVDCLDISVRLAQFECGVWLSRAPTFEEKSMIFPDATFIVGLDTILRIADIQYYGGNSRRRDEALHGIAARNGRFLVFGRVIDGVFRSLDDVALPPVLASICRAVPEDSFRHDIASSEIREAATDRD